MLLGDAGLGTEVETDVRPDPGQKQPAACNRCGCQERTLAATELRSSLLNRHHHLRQSIVQPLLLFRAEAGRVENHDELVQCPGKPKRHLLCVVLYHRRTRIFPDIEGFIEREAKPYGLRDLQFASGLLVDKQGRGRTPADATAVVLEGYTHDVIARWQRLSSLNLPFIFRLIGTVIGKDRLALQQQQSPTSKSATDGS